MARKPRPLISVTGGTPKGGALPLGARRGIDRGLSIQRPIVLAHLRRIRNRNPGADAVGLIHVLERHYLATVTASGATVGATAIIPGIGTGTTLALSGLETASFLEATALFGQSVSETHGLAVTDPERARSLVLAMMLGREGSELVRNWAGQATGDGPPREQYWGEVITNGLPQFVVGPLLARLRSVFLRRFAVRGGTGLVAKAIPFGVGAVVGGAGNHLLGRQVVTASRHAFGTTVAELARELEAGEWSESGHRRHSDRTPGDG